MPTLNVGSDKSRPVELTVIKGGPHGVNASHPEVFNKALLEFLGR